MTRPPRIDAGVFSAAKTGTVDAFAPMPMPSKRRQMSSWYQVCAQAEPITGRIQKMAQMKMVPRRPRRALSGSASQQPQRAEPTAQNHQGAGR
jgi:hypothetical protein